MKLAIVGSRECGLWAPDDVTAAVWCTKPTDHAGRCSHLGGWDWPGPGEILEKGDEDRSGKQIVIGDGTR